MRHAQAEAIGDSVPLDSERPLTPQGRTQVQQVITEFKRRKAIIPTIIFTSPLLRSRQTAELLAKLWKACRIFIKDELAPQGCAPRVRPLLEDAQPDQAILLVGHHPDMSYFLSELTDPSKTLISFSTATVVALRTDGPPPAHVLWSYSPY